MYFCSLCRPPKPRKERNELSVLDTTELDAGQLAEGAEAEEAVETALQNFREGEEEVAAAAAEMQDLLGIAAEADFTFDDEFLQLLSPEGPIMAAAPTAEELPDYEGPDVDLSGWIDSIVTTRLDS